jgi:hypothetical protein
VDCVSHPIRENFSGFLYDHGHFQADCVSRSVPGHGGQRVSIERLTDDRVAPNSLAQASLAVVARVALMPLRTCSAMARLLAVCAAAAPLTLARSLIWLEPLAAFAARPLATHRCLPPR